mgnify:CR=1 FL=1
MKTETTTNKKTNWSEKDAFLEERGKTVIDNKWFENLRKCELVRVNVEVKTEFI